MRPIDSSMEFVGSINPIEQCAATRQGQGTVDLPQSVVQDFMAVTLGIAGAARNAAVALCDDGRVIAVCEQERLTRTRNVGLRPGMLPARGGGRRAAAWLPVTRRRLRVCGRGARSGTCLAGLPTRRVDHHHAHAVTAFWTSPYDEAVVLVCDRHGVPDLTVWRADRSGLDARGRSLGRPRLRRNALPGGGGARIRPARGGTSPGSPGPRRCTEREYRAAAPGRRRRAARGAPGFKSALSVVASASGHQSAAVHASGVAQAVQRQLGELLLGVVARVRRRTSSNNLCLGGGFFYNSYFNTLIARAGLFENVFVPVESRKRRRGRWRGCRSGDGPSPGPCRCVVVAVSRTRILARGGEADPRQLQAVLRLPSGRSGHRTDRCLAGEGQAGRLVPGTHGVGTAALGNRSILASPLAPYVLENLNAFLKHREPYRCYSVAVCAEDAPRYFSGGPATSDFMEDRVRRARPRALSRACCR